MKLFLFALFLIAATSEMYAAVRPAESTEERTAERTPEKGSWAFYSREKKSKVAPQPMPVKSASKEESERSDSIKHRSSVSQDPAKKTPSQASTDSHISEESNSEKRGRTNEIIRYFQNIAHEILKSHKIPEVEKRKSLPWLIPAEERSTIEQYDECSRSKITNRLMRCTRECIENAYDLFSSLGRNSELEDLCIRRCTNSEKLFLVEKAKQIKSYNNRQQRRY